MRINKLILALPATATMAFTAQANEHTSHHGAHSSIEFSGHETALSELEFSRCWVRLVPDERPSAAYFDLKNTGTEAIALIAARADGFSDVMLHESTVVDGVSMMDMVEEVLVEAGQTISFKPKAHHIMLTAESEDAATVGDAVTLEFKFKGEQVASTQCLVKAINSLSFED